LYWLQFNVEHSGEDDEPQPMDTDNFQENEGQQQDENMEEGQNKIGQSNLAQGKDNKGVAGAAGMNNTAPGSNGVKQHVFHIASPNMTMTPHVEQEIEEAIFVQGRLLMI
jgi:hypothetical protein